MTENSCIIAKYGRKGLERYVIRFDNLHDIEQSMCSNVVSAFAGM